MFFAAEQPAAFEPTVDIDTLSNNNAYCK